MGSLRARVDRLQKLARALPPPPPEEEAVDEAELARAVTEGLLESYDERIKHLYASYDKQAWLSEGPKPLVTEERRRRMLESQVEFYALKKRAVWSVTTRPPTPPIASGSRGVSSSAP